MIYEWTYPQYNFDNNNVVIGVHWICTGIQDGITAASAGDVLFGYPNPAEGIPPEDITQAMLDSWVSQRLDMAAVQNEIDIKISEYSPP
jgi:hypothetical protein